MEIGSIGAGALAQAFAKKALKAGHKVKLSNHRGPDSLRELIYQLGPGATAASKEEAAACEMVLLAVPWDDVVETLTGIPKWSNRILIDGTNPFHGRAGKFTLADVGNLSTSRLFSHRPRKSSRWRIDAASGWSSSWTRFIREGRTPQMKTIHT
jgi:8-hydroxy-5-deazaflavin:NADPH oxidoreductase